MGVRFQVRLFEKKDQKIARQVVLTGLGEHFGFIDETRNPDLDDIESYYSSKGNVFVVALVKKDVVGTGGLVVGKKTGHIVRISVKKLYRRKGIGRKIVQYLLDEARRRNLRNVVVETEHGWDEVVRFYLYLGFIPYDTDAVDVHMNFMLSR